MKARVLESLGKEQHFLILLIGLGSTKVQTFLTFSNNKKRNIYFSVKYLPKWMLRPAGAIKEELEFLFNTSGLLLDSFSNKP
jgi:hypothetical protein